MLARIFLMSTAALATALQPTDSEAQTTTASVSSTTLADTDSASARGLDEVVVTAQRHESRIQDVPFSVSALSSADLTQSGVISVADLPTIVPGLTWSGQGGAWAEPALRGVSTNVASAGSGSPIAIYLDGVYQPEQGATPMDLADVTSIEVLKGPQGTLFGRNATGGAIQISTVEPSFRPEARFNTEVGEYFGGQSDSAAHVNAKGYISGPLLGDVVAASLSAFADYTPGYISEIRTGGRLGEIVSEGIRAKVLWKPGDHTEILATAYYSHRADTAMEAGVPLNGVTSGSQYPGAIYGTAPWTAAYFQPAKPEYDLGNFGASLRITQTLDGIGKISSTTGYNNYTPSARVGVDYSYSPACYAAFACLDFLAVIPEHALSEELLFTSEQLGRVQFVSGLYGFYDSASEHDRIDEGAALSTDDFVVTKSIAVFSEANIKLSDKLTAVTGIRLNHETKQAKARTFDGPVIQYADADWNNISPRVSLKYQFSDALNSYATFSEGFKGGVVAAQFSTEPPASPEKLYSYEIGAKYAQRDVSVNLAAFYYNYIDMQQEYNTGHGVVYPSNAASAQIYGLDLDSAVRLTDDFELKAGLEYLPQARFIHYPTAIAYVFPLTPFGLSTVTPYDASGSRLLLAPKLSASLTPEYTTTLPIGKLNLSSTVYYSSEYRFEVTDRIHQGAYARINAQATLEPANFNRLRVGVYVRNLTNKATISGVNATSIADAVYYNPPREVGLSLQLSY